MDPSISTSRAAPRPFPWSEAMAFGFGVLRLSSRDFWALTPRELASALEGFYGPAPQAPPRETLQALMRAFPDTAYQDQE